MKAKTKTASFPTATLQSLLSSELTPMRPHHWRAARSAWASKKNPCPDDPDGFASWIRGSFATKMPDEHAFCRLARRYRGRRARPIVAAKRVEQRVEQCDLIARDLLALSSYEPSGYVLDAGLLRKLVEKLGDKALAIYLPVGFLLFDAQRLKKAMRGLRDLENTVRITWTIRPSYRGTRESVREQLLCASWRRTSGCYPGQRSPLRVLSGGLELLPDQQELLETGGAREDSVAFRMRRDYALGDMPFVLDVTPLWRAREAAREVA